MYKHVLSIYLEQLKTTLSESKQLLKIFVATF